MLGKKIFRWLTEMGDAIRLLKNSREQLDEQRILSAAIVTKQICRTVQIDSLEDVELRVFSQWGDDGIVQWLVANLAIPNHRFIEFGVQDYWESTTRYLLLQNNWSGLVFDSSNTNIEKIKSSYYYPRYQLTAQKAFVSQENIADLLQANGYDNEVGLLHIDIDGMDYWVWKAIATPIAAIVIVEYNALFGPQRSITVPYDASFQRTMAHHSNLYYGASLGALKDLADVKGYVFIGCNQAGNNAYFVHGEHWKPELLSGLATATYIGSKFRESRDTNNNLSLLSGSDRLAPLAGLPVINTRTGEVETL